MSIFVLKEKITYGSNIKIVSFVLMYATKTDLEML